MTPIHDLLYAGVTAGPSTTQFQFSPFAPGASNAALMNAGYSGGSQIVHLANGSYPVASPVEIPAGVLHVYGVVDWYPATPTSQTLDFAEDWGGGVQLPDNSSAFAGAISPGASAGVYVRSGAYRIASTVTIEPGVLLVSGALDWQPLAPAVGASTSVLGPR